MCKTKIITDKSLKSRQNHDSTELWRHNNRQLTAWLLMKENTTLANGGRSLVRLISL